MKTHISYEEPEIVNWSGRTGAICHSSGSIRFAPRADATCRRCQARAERLDQQGRRVKTNPTSLSSRMLRHCAGITDAHTLEACKQLQWLSRGLRALCESIRLHNPSDDGASLLESTSTYLDSITAYVAENPALVRSVATQQLRSKIHVAGSRAATREDDFRAWTLLAELLEEACVRPERQDQRRCLRTAYVVASEMARQHSGPRMSVVRGGPHE